VISVILEQWDALLIYFQSESKPDNVDGAQLIYKALDNRGTKHMLCFLQYVLRKVNTLNLEFQSEIDPSDKRIHKQVQCIYLGGRTMSLLESEPLKTQTAMDEFKMDCLKFLTELCMQIKRRFPFDENDVIARLKVLDPKIASNLSSPSSIANLAAHFKSIVSENKLNDLDDEYRSFRMTKEHIGIDYNVNIPEFWYRLRDIKNGLGQPKYENLSNFMTNLTVLPHSSACVERIFSQVNTIKTKLTNKLKSNTTRDRILAKQSVTKYNNSCVTWQSKKELLKDLEDGGAYRRYSQRLKDAKNSAELITVYEAGDDE
jgi:hypothetical protein